MVRIEYASEDDVPFLQEKCGALHFGAWRAARAKGGVCWEWANSCARRPSTRPTKSSSSARAPQQDAATLSRLDGHAPLPRSCFEADDMGIKGGVKYAVRLLVDNHRARASGALRAGQGVDHLRAADVGMVDRGDGGKAINPRGRARQRAPNSRVGPRPASQGNPAHCRCGISAPSATAA